MHRTVIVSLTSNGAPIAERRYTYDPDVVDPRDPNPGARMRKMVEEILEAECFLAVGDTITITDEYPGATTGLATSQEIAP